MNSKEKIKNIKCLINEFYHDIKCKGELSEDARKCWLSYQKDCDDIEQDLVNYEVLKEEHNKTIENTYKLSKTYEKINKELEEENAKLKKVIEILKRFVTISYCRNEETNKWDIPVMYSFGFSEKITQEEYELLKEVF